MSLSGLDTVAVQEAHQSAIAEPGGWFLLKYTSRDEVELHGRGKGGVHEARLAIAKYQESSPLYGLLIYRRRKVLIKYIPVGTSRVLQARTAVHFQDVAERYSPYETLLEITTAEGLNDTSLAASFPLHTASLSASSSSRLHEISEDAEDGGSAPRRPSTQNQSSGSIFGTRQYKMEKRVDQIMRPTPPAIHLSTTTTTTTTDGATTNSTTLSPGKTSISSHILVREDSGKRSITSLASPLSESITSRATSTTSDTARESDSRSSLISSEASRTQPRTSSTLQRPSTQGSNNTATGVEPLLEESSLVPGDAPSPPASRGTDSVNYSERINKALDEPFDFSYLEPKPKIKLGPRPVASKRATTSGVSALPAHYRPSQRKADPQSTSPVSSTSSSTVYSSFPVPPIPASAEYNPQPISRGSVKSLPSHKSSTMTPDKIRLMKAVELRKKQLRKSNPSLPSVIPGVTSVAAPAVPQIPAQIPELPKQELKEIKLLDELREEEAVAKKADSGIEMNYRDKERQSEEAKTDHIAEQRESTESRRETRTTTTEQRVPVESQEDPVIAQALQKDELKAEAEGYGAVPAEVEESKAPTSLTPYGSPREQEANKQEVSPTLPPVDAPEPVLQPAQNASTTLQDITHANEQSNTKDVPTIAMSPASPLEPQHPWTTAAPMQKDDASDIEEEEEQNDHFAVQQSPRANNSAMAKRRRGIVEPLNIESQNELLSDEELMDELQEAIVHEAKPLAVARSPVNAYFPRRPSNQSLVSAASQRSDHSASLRTITANRERAAEELEDHENAVEPSQQGTQRSVSPIDRNGTLAGLRKNVGSGITKRFHALTDGRLDVATSPATVSPTTSHDGSPSDRRIRGSPRSRAGSFKGRWGIGDRTSSSSTLGLSTENAPVWSVSQDNSGNRDSIHVKARIVRPPSALDTHAETPDSEDTAQMQHSKLEINHRVGSGASRPLPGLNTASFPSNEARTAPSPTSRRQLNLAMTPITQPEDFPAPPSTRVPSSVISDDASTITSNAGSRTSRLWKRMSSSLGGVKRRSIPQSSYSVQSPSNADTGASVNSLRTTSTLTERDRSDMPPAAALGDLNVQFPDTLLWKRRWLTLDEAGNLVIGTTLDQHITTSTTTTQTRRQHLSDFKLPHIPDLDRMEMPHSICLDLNEGGTLQIACEDAMGQRQVLSMLTSYWRSWVG